MFLGRSILSLGVELVRRPMLVGRITGPIHVGAKTTHGLHVAAIGFLRRHFGKEGGECSSHIHFLHAPHGVRFGNLRGIITQPSPDNG